jgi:cysteine desulfurase
MAAARICYLDANGTTLMPQAVLDALLAWSNRGNPSAQYSSAVEVTKMMNAFRQSIAVESGFELTGPNAFAVVFTSGASESNCHIVTSAVRSYAASTGVLPHIITSAIEHNSLLECCRRLAAEKLCHLTVLPVGQFGENLGAVAASDLEAAIRSNTCLVTIMAANNETGILNNIRELARVAGRARVPFHSDAAQLFGKSAVRPTMLGIDAFSASFHKLHGPPGVGVLAIRRKLVSGYKLSPHICGDENYGLRGGTENVPGIGASYAAFRHTMTDRATKTARVQRLRDAIKSVLASRVPCFYLDEHPADSPPSIDGGITPPLPAQHHGSHDARVAIALSEKDNSPIIFWIAPQDSVRVLPNTLLLAVRRPGFCNRAARAALEARGVILSVGGACSSGSRVFAAMGVPHSLRSGILRISLADVTNAGDIKAFVSNFLAVIRSDECLLA